MSLPRVRPGVVFIRIKPGATWAAMMLPGVLRVCGRLVCRWAVLVCLGGTGLLAVGQEAPIKPELVTSPKDSSGPGETVAQKISGEKTQLIAKGKLSFDILSKTEITTVAKRPQIAEDVPATVRVITRDDIAHSGATSIPEALRLAPGVNVAQINAASWAVGVRGFQWEYATKLLVMIDGRSVYSPSFGGVHWDVQTYPMSDIDRIEVVLGPGSTMWGSNAMNGVINVVTKSARETVGGLTSLRAGPEGVCLMTRHGWQVGGDVYASAYVRSEWHDDTVFPDGEPADDALRMLQTGFKVDGGQLAAGRWTIHGDAYTGRREMRISVPSRLAPPTYYVETNEPTELEGGNVLGKWERAVDSDGLWSIQAYYDYAGRSGSVIETKIHTLDFELHRGQTLPGGHRLDGGVGARHIKSTSADRLVAFRPKASTEKKLNAFLQDEWALGPEGLLLTAGTKIEHQAISGTELLPALKLLWSYAPQSTAWLGYSHTARQPSQVEADARFDGQIFPPGRVVPGIPAIARIEGNQNLKAEIMDAYECGWRVPLGEKIGMELSGFVYNYRRLLLVSQEAPELETAPTTALVLPSPYANGLNGESYGGGLMLWYDPRPGWRLRGGMNYTQIQLHAYKPDPLQYEQDEDTTPHVTAFLQSLVRFGKDWSLDAALRYVDNVPYYNVPSYLELDAQVGWRLRDGVELFLMGKSLLHDDHVEYSPSFVGRQSRIQRTGYVKLVLRY